MNPKLRIAVLVELKLIKSKIIILLYLVEKGSIN